MKNKVEKLRKSIFYSEFCKERRERPQKRLKSSTEKGNERKGDGGKRAKFGRIWGNLGAQNVPIMLQTQTKQDEGNGNFQGTRARSSKKARRNL